MSYLGNPTAKSLEEPITLLRKKMALFIRLPLGHHEASPLGILHGRKLTYGP